MEVGVGSGFGSGVGSGSGVVPSSVTVRIAVSERVFPPAVAFVGSVTCIVWVPFSAVVIQKQLSVT